MVGTCSIQPELSSVDPGTEIAQVCEMASCLPVSVTFFSAIQASGAFVIQFHTQIPEMVFRVLQVSSFSNFIQRIQYVHICLGRKVWFCGTAFVRAIQADEPSLQ